tara:strand:- start:6 stop:5249 length:5244 start_codon:yes stop_codon:yes gene_type:complete
MEWNLVGVDMVNVTLNLRDCADDDTILEGWMSSFTTRYQNSIEDFNVYHHIDQQVAEGQIPSHLHGLFLEAFLNLPKRVGESSEKHRRYHQIMNPVTGDLAEDENDPLESWITELIQNAVDLKATEINLSIGQDDLIFYHNGRSGGHLFNNNQLSSIFNIANSTKLGDFSKIGKFGIGFKYWWRHFENLKVKCVEMVDGNLEELSIGVSREFSVSDTDLCFRTVDQDEIGTYFEFSNPIEAGDWTNDLAFRNDDDSVIARRLYESLPFIQLRVENDFTLNVSILGTEYEYYCEVVGDIQCDDFRIDKIKYGKRGERDEEELLYRASCRMDSLTEELEDEFTRFRSMVVEEYENTEILNQNIGAQAHADRALSETSIACLYMPDIDHGMISNLFIANHPDSFISAPMIIEAPWKLNRDRVRIEQSKEKYKLWNRILGKFVDALHGKFTQFLIGHESNLDYSNLQLCNIINTPLGEVKNFSMVDGKYVQHLEGEEKLPLENLGNRILNRSRTYSLGQRMGVPEGSFFSPKELLHLWIELDQLNDEESFLWFQNSLHSNIATIELANGTKLPITFQDSHFSKFHQIEKSISRNCGDGIPQTIRDLFAENELETDTAVAAPDVENTDQLTESYPFRSKQLKFFDDIVCSVNENLFFASEKTGMPIVDITNLAEDDATLISLFTGVRFLQESTGDEDKVLFYESRNNIPNHEVVEEHLDEEQGIEEVISQCYQESELIEERDSQNLKSWINSRLGRKWGDSILLNKSDGLNEMPVFLKLPESDHSIAVVLGLESRRELKSINRRKLINQKEVVFGDNPMMLQWNLDSDDILFCRLHNRHEWIDDASPFDEDGARSKSLDGCAWNWSDLVPEGRTGWNWLRVTMDNVASDEERIDIERALNPVFVDGFYETSAVGEVGVHRGYRFKNNDDGVISVRKTSLHHYSRGSENTSTQHLTYLSHPVKSDSLLKHSIHLHPGVNFEQHRTIQENEKILLSHDDVHPHGLLRVYGWQIFHTERISWDFEIEDTRELDFLNLQTEAEVGSSIRDDFKSKIEIYDVLLTRGGGSRNNPLESIGFFAKSVDYSQHDDGYLSDDDTPRFREGSYFSDLRAKGIHGFKQFCDEWFKSNKSFARLFRSKLWLPTSTEFHNRFQGNEFYSLNEFIQFVPIREVERFRAILISKTSNLDRDITHRNPEEDRWIFRYGLAWLFWNLQNSELGDDEKEICLSWLNDALECGFPRKQWLDANARVYTTPHEGIRLNSKPREILTQLGDLSDYPNVQELLELRDMDSEWWRFRDRCYTSGDEASYRSLRQEFEQMHMKELIVTENQDFYRVGFHPRKTLQSFRTGDDEPRRVLVHEVKSSLTPKVLCFDDIGGETPIFVLDNMHMFNVIENITNQGELELINLSDSLIPHETQLEGDQHVEHVPRQFLFIHKILSEINCLDEVHWIQRNELQTTAFVSPGNSGLQLSLNQNKITFYHAENVENLSSDEYDFISKLVFEYCEEEIGRFEEDVREWVNQPSNREPLPSWVRRKYRNNQEHRVEEDILFKEKYCQSELNFRQFTELVQDISNLEELNTALERLVQKYRQRDDYSLKDSHVMLREWYRNIPAVTMDRTTEWQFPGIIDPDDSVSVNRIISIDANMLYLLNNNRLQRYEIEGTAGGTLLVNPFEQSWYRPIASYGRVEESYDFNEDIANLMYQEIVDSWFTSVGDFLVIDEALVSNNNTKNGLLMHKHHALHVYAFLRAMEVDEYA